MAIPLGPFDLIELLGRGGMGAVWRGVHREQSFPVAVKALSNESAHDPRFREEFKREVQAVAGLAHPGIVSVYDYGHVTDDAARASKGELVAGSPVLAMELADRGSLCNLNLVPDWPALRELLLQILDALGYAHARGVIHRDVKPSNILLSSVGRRRVRYKLTDFGIAHALDPLGRPDTLEDGIYRGSPDYSPPEQLEGAWRDYGPWTDLYAVGCVAYEFAAGRPPFMDKNFIKLAMRHMDEPPPPIEPRFAVPHGFEPWVMRLLAKDPRRRFRRAADAAWSLISMAPNLTGTQRTPSEIELEDAPTRRRQVDSVEVTPTGPRRHATEARADDSLDDTSAEPPTLALPEMAWAAQQNERMVGDRPALADEAPPLPPTWRRSTPSRADKHLIGAGLSLFGLREVEFVGREAERDVVWEALREVAADRRPRAVYIHGASGTGKSRLAEWLGQRAHEIGAASVLTANHSPHAAPADGLRRMLEHPLSSWGQGPYHVHERVREAIDVLFTIDAPQEDAYLLDYTARGVTEFMRPGRVANEALDGPAVDLRSKRERYAVLARFLEALAHHRPLYVWLDDIAWGSEALGLVEYMLESYQQVPILFVMTARDEDLAAHPSIAERLDALASLDAVDDIELGPLPSPNHAELIERLLTLGPDLAWQVEERTAGNPLFAVQLVRDWVERDVLEPSPQGYRLRAGAEAPLPDDLSELCASRVDRFLQRRYPERHAEVRQALEVAAALGREVDAVEWRTACKNVGLDLPDDLIEAMVNHQLAYRRREGWSLIHGALREVIERGARLAGRWSYHQHNCIQMLDELYGLETPGVWKRWGEHLYQAGELQEALEPLLAAANRARQADDCPTGLQILDRVDQICEALQLDEDVRRVRAWLQRAYLLRHYRHAHDRERARNLIDASMQLARRRGWLRELGLALLEEARTFAHEGRFGRALGSFESARSIFEENGLHEEAVTTLLSMVASHRRLGQYSQMHQMLKRARRLCPAHDSRHRALVHERYAQYYLDGPQRDLEQATVHAERFLRAAQQHLSPGNEAQAWLDLGEIARLQSHHDEARQNYQRAYALSNGAGAIRLPWVALFNIGMTDFERGEFADAKRWFRDSRVHMERTGHRIWTALPSLGIAACEANLGHWKSARALFDKASERITKQKHYVRDLAVLAEAFGRAALDVDLVDLARRALELAAEHWQAKEPEAAARCAELLRNLE